MKTQNLSDLICLKIQEILIPLTCNRKINLRNQSCLFLFHNKKFKDFFIEQLTAQNEVQICVISPLTSLEMLKNKKILLDHDINSFSNLLEKLQLLLDGYLYRDFVLNTLVIDNISVFYWDLKILNASNYKSLNFNHYMPASNQYALLSRLIDDIKSKYNCNVIVTSYDISFQKGYNSNWEKTSSLVGLSRFSYLPKKFIFNFDYIFHSSSIATSYFEKSQNVWVLIDSTTNFLLDF